MIKKKEKIETFSKNIEKKTSHGDDYIFLITMIFPNLSDNS